MHPWFAPAMVVGLAAVLAAAVREVVVFRRARYATRRLMLRLATAGALVILFAGMLVGVAVFGLNEPIGQHTHFLAFWGCITLLTGAVFCLVIADLRMLSRESDEDARRLWREIATMIAEHERSTVQGEERSKEGVGRDDDHGA